MGLVEFLDTWPNCITSINVGVVTPNILITHEIGMTHLASYTMTSYNIYNVAVSIGHIEYCHALL